MSAPKSNLSRVTGPSDDTDAVEYFVSDPEPMEDGEGDWGFAVYEAEDIWVCTFTYPSQASAARARHAVLPVLAECVFLATEES